MFGKVRHLEDNCRMYCQELDAILDNLESAGREARKHNPLDGWTDAELVWMLAVDNHRRQGHNGQPCFGSSCVGNCSLLQAHLALEETEDSPLPDKCAMMLYLRFSQLQSLKNNLPVSSLGERLCVASAPSALKLC